MRCGCGGWCILGDQNVGKAIRLGPGPERGFDTPVSVEERCKKGVCYQRSIVILCHHLSEKNGVTVRGARTSYVPTKRSRCWLT